MRIEKGKSKIQIHSLKCAMFKCQKNPPRIINLWNNVGQVETVCLKWLLQNLNNRCHVAKWDKIKTHFYLASTSIKDDYISKSN